MKMKINYSNLPQTWSCIVIDGDPGAGKTTLAKEMAKILRVKAISFDDYLPEDLEDKRPYSEKLNYEILRRVILQAGPKVVVEGVLALKVLDKIGVRHDYHIFIKRFDGFLGWRFGEYLEGNAKPPKDKFWQEIVQYYKERKPFDICDEEMSRDICAP
jgi:energy-coupling factor transporter ATP-binding protein EcfA2